MTGNKAFILVVDDDQDIRETIADVLIYEGYDVAQARDGVEALTWLHATPRLPDLILLDLMMPRMNGPQFCERRRRDPRVAGLPVILLSADPHIREEEERLQVAGSLRKPVGLAQLLSAIEQSLPVRTSASTG